MSCSGGGDEGEKGKENPGEGQGKPVEENKTEKPEFCVVSSNYEYSGNLLNAVMFKSVENEEKYTFYYRMVYTSGEELIGEVVGAYIGNVSNYSAMGIDITFDDECLKKITTNTQNCNRVFLFLKDNFKGYKNFGVKAKSVGKEYSEIKWSRDLTDEETKAMTLDKYKW